MGRQTQVTSATKQALLPKDKKEKRQREDESSAAAEEPPAKKGAGKRTFHKETLARRQIQEKASHSHEYQFAITASGKAMLKNREPISSNTIRTAAAKFFSELKQRENIGPDPPVREYKDVGTGETRTKQRNFAISHDASEAICAHLREYVRSLMSGVSYTMASSGRRVAGPRHLVGTLCARGQEVPSYMVALSPSVLQIMDENQIKRSLVHLGAGPEEHFLFDRQKVSEAGEIAKIHAENASIRRAVRLLPLKKGQEKSVLPSGDTRTVKPLSDEVKHALVSFLHELKTKTNADLRRLHRMGKKENEKYANAEKKSDNGEEEEEEEEEEDEEEEEEGSTERETPQDEEENGDASK